MHIETHRNTRRIRLTQLHARSICCDDVEISRYDYRDYDIIITSRMADGCRWWFGVVDERNKRSEMTNGPDDEM